MEAIPCITPTCTGCCGQRAKQGPGFSRVWSVWCTFLFHSGGSNSPISSAAEHWKRGELSNAVPFQRSLVHPKLCEYLRCPACFCSPHRTAAVLPAPSTLLRAPTATGIWEVTPPFPGSGGDGGCREFQSVCFTVISASKHAVHLLEGKNKAALFNFWKKPDDSGRGQKYAYQPSLSHSQLLLPERQKHVVAKNTLQREYILSPMGEYKLIQVVTYTTACGWEKQFQM